MKKMFFILIATFSIIGNSFAYQLLSTKEYGKGDAKNQNITVRCTTDIGKNSSETCSIKLIFISYKSPSSNSSLVFFISIK